MENDNDISMIVVIVIMIIMILMTCILYYIHARSALAAKLEFVRPPSRSTPRGGPELCG